MDDVPDWAREAPHSQDSGNVEENIVERSSDVKPDVENQNEAPPSWLDPSQQHIEAERFSHGSEYAAVDVENQPGWYSGKSDRPKKPSPSQENRYKPAWSERQEPLLEHSKPDTHKGSAPGDSCVAAIKKIFCSFRTTLVPLLLVISALSVLSFVVRIQLSCSWNGMLLQTYSIVGLVLALGLMYSVLKGSNWMCTAWFFSVIFSLGSAIIAICEWVNEMDHCKHGTDAGGTSVQSWAVPSSTTLLVILWGLSAHLFNKGAKELELEQIQNSARS